jgi:hypothetical protein
LTDEAAFPRLATASRGPRCSRQRTSCSASDLGRKLTAKRRVIDRPAVSSTLVRLFKTDRMSFSVVVRLGDVADVAALDVWRPQASATLTPLLEW